MFIPECNICKDFNQQIFKNKTVAFFWFSSFQFLKEGMQWDGTQCVNGTVFALSLLVWHGLNEIS